MHNNNNSAPALIGLAAGTVFAVISLALLSGATPQTPPPDIGIGLQRQDAAFPCENAIISDGGYNNTIYTCLHPLNSKPASPIVFHLPVPTYKMVECTSTYGCSHRYNYQEIIPPNLLSDEQKKQVLDKVMSLPEVKMNAGWKLDNFTVQPDAYRWIGHVQLFIDGIKQLPPSQDCGWYGQIDLDLETLQVIGMSNVPLGSMYCATRFLKMTRLLPLKSTDAKGVKRRLPSWPDSLMSLPRRRAAAAPTCLWLQLETTTRMGTWLSQMAAVLHRHILHRLQAKPQSSDYHNCPSKLLPC